MATRNKTTCEIIITSSLVQRGMIAGMVARHIKLTTSQDLTENIPIAMDLSLVDFPEAFLGLLGSVSWATQKASETLENVLFWLPDRSGRAATSRDPSRTS